VTSQISLYYRYILGRVRLSVTHELQGPKQKESATSIPQESLPSETFDARSQR
jgi:hypothetical protein